MTMSATCQHWSYIGMIFKSVLILKVQCEKSRKVEKHIKFTFLEIIQHIFFLIFLHYQKIYLTEHRFHVIFKIPCIFLKGAHVKFCVNYSQKSSALNQVFLFTKKKEKKNNAPSTPCLFLRGYKLESCHYLNPQKNHSIFQKYIYYL